MFKILSFGGAVVYKKKLFLRILSFVMSAVMLSFSVQAFAAVMTFETQYDYDEAELAWLTDLVIKEDMTTVEGMSQRCDLVPVPVYPYTETAASFREEVNYFVSLYDLDLGSQRAGYIYFFEILNANSNLLAADISDADIREYLEGVGIVYPDVVGSDELIIARALFTAMVTGSLNNNVYKNGTSLETVLVTYLADITGMNMATLKNWMPGSSILSIDDYILAASKLALWSNGYNVSVSTDADEVYRLLAVMTVKKQGITADSSLSYEKLKLSYMAALLGKKYNVTVDSAKLGAALENDAVAYYMLQLIGKKSGLSIREDNASYERAFELVAENTGVFDVSSEDFYADIYLYDVYLKSRCSSLWIYPTAYATGNSKYNVIISVNGQSIRNNYYNEVLVDITADVVTLSIKVTVSGNGESSDAVYTVNVHQGSYSEVPGDKPVADPSAKPGFVTSDSLVADVLATLGINSVISAVLDKSYIALPKTVASVVAFIAPTFDSDVPSGILSGEENSGDTLYISVLDEVGAMIDTDIKGIEGLDLTSVNTDDLSSFVTFD